MKKLIAAVIVFSAGALFARTRVIENIPYSKASDQCVLKLRLPEGVTNFATVIWLHGGGLTGGKLCLGPWPAEAPDDPIAVVGVGYRLMKKGSDGVRPADCIDDAAAATAWTLEHIADYGGDPKKVILSGCSAGGYLTAMVGMDGRWLGKYGHERRELAGLVPFTGQMTKHFNVRAIGFRDKDPQFAPKVDEWAPLFYAGAKGIPPISFVCGGRDCEWKGRVEETELLAEALRDSGNCEVEFHETEGDHGGGVLESKYFLRDFVAKRVDAGIVGRFAGGERVSFVDDSVTNGCRAVGYLQLFQSLRNPGFNTRLMSCGIPGGAQRFEGDLMRQNPDRVFTLFGLDDPSLADRGETVRRIAREHHLRLFEFHRPLAAIHKAAHVLDAMAYSPFVARVMIDAKAKLFVPVKVNDSGSRNCRATAIAVTTNGVAFTYAPKALPLPASAAYRATDRFNREMLVIRNLPAGDYRIAFDGAVVGRATAAELEKGVNIALWNTPNQRLAMKAAGYVDELVGVWSQRQSAREQLDALATRDEDLREMLNAIRPAVSRVSVLKDDRLGE